jgi:hypothetical protein
MPCVQAINRTAREQYLRANRRTVNEFRGITDPVEILKLHHQPRKYSEFLDWLPYRKPIDELYARLSTEQVTAIKEYCLELCADGHSLEADEILASLAAFTNANLDDCLSRLLDRNSDPVPLAFRRAGLAIGDRLLQRMDDKNANIHWRLKSLAWIGDANVVDHFAAWRHSRPSWAGSLRVPPHHYTHCAGWELTADDQRHDLYFEKAVALKKQERGKPERVQFARKRSDVCFCGRALINLLEFDFDVFSIFAGAGALQSMRVPSCSVCTTFETMFGLRDRTKGDWSVLPTSSHKPQGEWLELSPTALSVTATRNALHAADASLPTTFTQIGGVPAWIQDAEYPGCPSCAKTMTFLAQLAHDELEPHSEGMYYCFVCLPCASTATTYQQT